jgi:hypothetical protein
LLVHARWHYRLCLVCDPEHLKAVECTIGNDDFAPLLQRNNHTARILVLNEENTQYRQPKICSVVRDLNRCSATGREEVSEEPIVMRKPGLQKRRLETCHGSEA